MRYRHESVPGDQNGQIALFFAGKTVARSRYFKDLAPLESHKSATPCDSSERNAGFFAVFRRKLCRLDGGAAYVKTGQGAAR